MAVTIYQVLNLSESILEPFKDKPFLLTNYFLSSATYIHNIYKVGMLEFVEEDAYRIIARIAVLGRWRDVIEVYALKKGSWRQINPKNIVINEEWKALDTFGTYDGG